MINLEAGAEVGGASAGPAAETADPMTDTKPPVNNIRQRSTDDARTFVMIPHHKVVIMDGQFQHEGNIQIIVLDS